MSTLPPRLGSAHRRARTSQFLNRIASTLNHLSLLEEAPVASNNDQQPRNIEFNNLPYELRRKICKCWEAATRAQNYFASFQDIIACSRRII